ncbi:MAG: DUF167 domain-containing protein [Fimbriimonadales bacterium]
MANSCELSVRATPRAKKPRILVENGQIKAYVAEPADDNRANEAIRQLFSKKLGIPLNSITIEKGQKSRQKQIRVLGLTEPDVIKKLSAT